MKKIYIWSILTLIITTFLPGGLCAQESTSANEAGDAVAQRETHVTPAQALNVGYTFMRTGTGTRGGGTHSSSVSKQAMQLVYTGQATDSLTDAVTDCYYVFALQPKGFVIVAADDRVEPILGYSYDNDFVVMNMPTHVRGWLGNYEQQIQEVAKSNLQAEPATQTKWARLKSGQSMSTRSGDTVVGPLLTTTWDQGQYYNVLCPEDVNGPDGHVYTGCVATAMAQIINYWGYPEHGRGTHSYNVSNLDPNSMGFNYNDYGTLSVNFDSATYDYDHMPNELSATSNPQEVSAVAQLMYHCGVAVNMFYSPSASGAYEENVRRALISYYGFAPTLGYAQRQMYTKTAWTDSLMANIDRGEPVLYSGRSLFGAHAFVLDGYKQDGFFHFNFGWSGDGDGWYQISAINPGMNFNDWQTAIMGIHPDSNAHAVICHRVMGVQQVDNFTVTEPIDLYPLRGNSLYETSNEEIGVGFDLNLVPEDSTGQLVIDILNFGSWQCVAIYDGLNKDSLIREIETQNQYEMYWNTDLSPIVSSRHGFTVAVCGIGGMPEGFRLRVRDADDTTHIDSTTTNNVLYWTDVVTSEPQGYLLDGDTIRISSPEGFAWVAHCLDSLWFVAPDWEVYQYYHHSISIENDLNMEEYLWKPIKAWFGNIDGHGHVIRNTKISSTSWNVAYLGGFFSFVGDAEISNVGMIHSKVNGFGNMGTVAGTIQNCTMKNCYSKDHHISIGNGTGGGLCGSAEDGSLIINCFAYGYLSSQFGYGGLVGGLGNSEIINCVSHVGETFNWTQLCDPPSSYGLLSESAGGGSVSNCFADISIAKRYWYSDDPEYLALAKRAFFLGNADNVDSISNMAAFNISIDSMGTLIADTAVNYTLGDSMDVLTALNNKVEEYNSSDLRTWVRDSITHLPVFGNYYGVAGPNVRDTIVVCEKYTWHGVRYTTSGTYTYEDTTANGCACVDTLILIVNHGTHNVETETTCEEFNWHGTAYGTSGTYTYGYTNACGCPSADTLFLTILPASSGGEFADTGCDWYDWNGFYLTENGDYFQNFPTADGCDSIVTLHLTISHPVTDFFEATACDSYTWNDSVYTQSGDYTQTFTAASGCDSVVTLYLTVNHPVMEYIENTACDSYIWNDTIYSQSGDYTQTFTAASGCDSVVTLHLTVNQSYSGVDFVSSNESYTWADNLYIASGIYEHTWTTAEGCDSTVSLWLTITKTQYDTTYVDVHDTTYIDVHDTTYIDVYVPVHDTTYVDVYVPVHDTTYIDVHDTTYVNVHDTTYLWQYDTTYVNVPYPVHDTTYVNVHDTSYVDVPYPVHDTTYVDVHDTTYLWQHDTTYVTLHDTTILTLHDTTYIDVPYPVHDTTYVTLTDTIILNHYDTTYIDVPYPVHDTTYVTLTDTIVLNHYDTTYITLHDTITIIEPLTWYSLQVLSEDMDKGVAAGSGQFPEGTDVEIAAIPIEGNRFLQWSDGSESNPHTITLNDNLTLTAMFTTVGVTNLELPSWYVYPEKGAFVVKGTGGHQVSVYDAVGKLLHRYSDAPEILRYSIPAAGSYYIQVDNGAAKKVTVVR